MSALVIWFALRNGASAGLSWLLASREHIAWGLAAALSFFALHEAHRADREHKARVQWVAMAKSASAKAASDQIAVNHQPAAISAAIAEDTNAQAPIQAARVRAAVDAYARAHPAGCVLPDGADRAGNPGLPGANPPASGGGGADVSPDMVAIPLADLEGFASNTRDLDALRAALAGLIARGVAIVDTKTPEGKQEMKP